LPGSGTELRGEASWTDLPMDVDGAYGTGIYMIPLNAGPDTRSRG
jgi:hypothetical protein